MKTLEFLIILSFVSIFFYFVFSLFSKNLPENFYDDKHLILKTLNQLSFLDLRELVYRNDTEKIREYLEKYLNYEFYIYICENNCSFFEDSKFSLKYFFFGYNDFNPKILILYVR